MTKIKRHCKLCGAPMSARRYRTRKSKNECYDCTPKYGLVPFATRFWDKVDIRPGKNSCWLWLASTFANPMAFGQIQRIVTDGITGKKRKVNLLAHREAYILEYGPIRGDLCVLHACSGGPLCVRPSHLYLGTRREQAGLMVKRGMIKKVGIQNPSAKLTEKDVLEIRRRFADGENCPSIKKDYPVITGTIKAIVQRRLWKHL